MSLERKLGLIHGWLGVLVLPWVLAIGLTGLYMNHSAAVLSWLPEGSAVVPEGAPLPGAAATDLAAAQAIAARVWPGAEFALERDDSFRGRSVFRLSSEKGEVVVDRATGLYWTRTRYVVALHDPQGERIGREIRWSRVLRSLHTDGWLGGALGSWPVDIAAGALVIFATTGLAMFVSHRLRRFRTRGQAGANEKRIHH